jgi:hypothetical protein
MAIHVKFDLEKDMFIAYLPRKDELDIILAVADTFAEAISKSYERAKRRVLDRS